MLCRLRLIWLGRAALLVLITAGSSATLQAQTDEEDGGVTNGVMVDAEGVLRRQTFSDPSGNLHRERVNAARASLAPELAKPSKLRKISLNRLEAAIRARIERNMPPTEEMQYLAGMTRLKYVFFYPETKDIVFAGPAEGWAADPSGRVRGLTSGRPMLELQDLIVALRAFPPSGKKSPVILCSIDPSKEGLQRMQAFLKELGGHATPGDTEMIVDGLRTRLGMQNIRVGGIAANTHFAQVMIEADYRMKLIGIGVEKPPVRLASYVDKANPAQVNKNALQRWYFIPDYHCVSVTPDELGMELSGDGVKLVGEDEVVLQDGTRSITKRSNRASKLFVDGFTRKYASLAAKAPVFAQLRNVIDLAIAAAFVQKHDYYGKSGWNMATLGDEKALPVETYNTPLQVETVVTSVWKGNRLMTPVGGGVNIRPSRALEPANVREDDEGKVTEARESISLKNLAADRWWWD